MSGKALDVERCSSRGRRTWQRAVISKQLQSTVSNTDVKGCQGSLSRVMSWDVMSWDVMSWDVMGWDVMGWDVV
jgi:hypothetical protein